MSVAMKKMTKDKAASEDALRKSDFKLDDGLCGLLTNERGFGVSCT